MNGADPSVHLSLDRDIGKAHRINYSPDTRSWEQQWEKESLPNPVVMVAGGQC